jgi:hypothetical protein
MQRRREQFRHGATRRGWANDASGKVRYLFQVWRIFLPCKQYTSTLLPRLHRSHIASIGGPIGYTLEVAASFPTSASLSTLLSASGLPYVPHSASHRHFFFQSLGNKYNSLFKCALSVTCSCMPPQDTLIAVRTYDLAFFYNGSS